MTVFKLTRITISLADIDFCLITISLADNDFPGQ